MQRHELGSMSEKGGLELPEQVCRAMPCEPSHLKSGRDGGMLDEVHIAK